MSKLVVKGGATLSGSVRVQGAKNSALPILAASIISGGESVIHNCPDISDVDDALEILRYLGCRARRDGTKVTVDSSELARTDIPEELMCRMRGSVLFLGALVARAGEAKISAPGGCRLGPRPVDLHLRALRAIGIDASENEGSVRCRCAEYRGGLVYLPIPSVGATENAMAAASRARGTTVIVNAAREPEICDLACYLSKLGVRVFGAGSSTVTIEGRKTLNKAAEHRLIPDRIAAATYLCCAAAAGGKAELRNVCVLDICPVIRALREMGCEISSRRDSLTIVSKGKLRAHGGIVTGPYPAFPTDAQPPLMAASVLAEGSSVFTETVFEKRYRHVPELIKLGADIEVEGKRALVRGLNSLRGCELKAEDLRGGAALATAALRAEGETVISGFEYVKRGYEGFGRTLSELGAQVVEID